MTMDRPIGSSENARTARQVVLVDPMTGAPGSVGGTGAGALQVQGVAASNAQVLGNPILTGGRAGATQVTYDHNDIAPIDLGTRGHVMVGGEQFNQITGASSTPCAVADRTGGAGRVLATVPYLNNGTSLDQSRKPNAISRTVSSSASTNATLVKNAPGDLRAVFGHNASASLLFLKLYNKASLPTVGTDSPALSLALPPSSSFSFDFSGHYFSAGIGFALTAGAADGDTAAIGAGDIVCLNVTYA